MMIFQLPIFLVPPQDLVPYAQRVVRVMGAAALLAYTHSDIPGFPLGFLPAGPAPAAFLTQQHDCARRYFF